MLAITAILQFFARLAAAWAGFGTSLVIGGVAVMEVVSAAMRVLRMGIVVTILMVVLAQFVPTPVSSFTNLWASQMTALGPVATYVGWFVPIDLLTTLLDWYVLLVMSLVVVSVVRRVMEAGW